MSSFLVQEQRKAGYIADAAEAVKEAKPDTGRLDEVLAEPLIGDEHRLAALVAELAEQVLRQERAIEHVGTHVVASQDKEIERLQKRVEQLEKGSSKGAAKK
jgi:uncharacterized coiled-coil protein SlyX